MITDLKELMDNVLEEMKGRWDFYRHAAYLKKQGWTEDEYQRYEDPNMNRKATRVKDYYQKYPHLHAFHSTRTLPWTEYAEWTECYNAMNKWCDSNCKEKWRSDILRVIKAPSTGNEWELNDIGGGDSLFYAFKDQKDYVNFLLKWV